MHLERDDKPRSSRLTVFGIPSGVQYPAKFEVCVNVVGLIVIQPLAFTRQTRHHAQRGTDVAVKLVQLKNIQLLYI